MAMQFSLPCPNSLTRRTRLFGMAFGSRSGSRMASDASRWHREARRWRDRPCEAAISRQMFLPAAHEALPARTYCQARSCPHTRCQRFSLVSVLWCICYLMAVFCCVWMRSREVYLPSLDAQLQFWQPRGCRSLAAFAAPGLPRRQRLVTGRLFALIERESYSAGKLPGGALEPHGSPLTGVCVFGYAGSGKVQRGFWRCQSGPDE
jgi:hypothetical protein